jgi:hypothetical protein
MVYIQLLLKYPPLLIGSLRISNEIVRGYPRLPASLLGGDKQRSPDWKAPRTSEGE